MECLQEFVVCCGVDVGQCVELCDQLWLVVLVDMCYGVWVECWDYLVGQFFVQVCVLCEVVGCWVGGGDQFDVESVEQCVRVEFWFCELCHDLVVQVVGGFCGWVYGQFEDFVEFVFELVLVWCIEEQVLVGVEFVLDFLWFCCLFVVLVGQVEFVGGDVLGDQYLGYVVVWDDQQFGWVVEWGVGGEQFDVDVVVQVEQWQVFCRVVDLVCDVMCWIGWQGVVWMRL